MYCFFSGPGGGYFVRRCPPGPSNGYFTPGPSGSPAWAHGVYSLAGPCTPPTVSAPPATRTGVQPPEAGTVGVCAIGKRPVRKDALGRLAGRPRAAVMMDSCLSGLGMRSMPTPPRRTR